MSEEVKKWKFAVDRGGTFTDVIGLDPDGNFHTDKLLSVSDKYDDASIEGIRRVLGLPYDKPLPEDKIEGIRFGTTVATNALLERKGCSTALLITEGFSDLLEIGYQDRPEIFDLCIKKPSPLYSSVIEVDERIGENGKIIRTFNRESFEASLKSISKDAIDSVAVVLMHSWRNPEHELVCEEILKEKGFSNIFLSHKTINLIKIVSRGQSTVVDSYLSLILSQYLDGIKKETGDISVSFMQSSGLLTPPERFFGKNALLSGPAGGAIAASEIAKERGIKGIIGFDMGGTSTDVSRYEGTLEKVYEHVIEGIPLQTEMLNIVTVAAGGGSILGFDGQKMIVGPESAGALPGPASYGMGGPLTITDANIMTGRVIPEHFPKTFGSDGKSPLNIEIVKNKFSEITNEINSTMGSSYTPEDTALGFLRVADEKMAMAIKEISVSKGFDVRDYALLSFGGAGGQHACSIASLLDIEKIIIHPLSSLLSAYGIGLSKPASKSERSLLMPYTEGSHSELTSYFEEMEKDLLPRSAHEEERHIIKREIDLRPTGSDTFLTLEHHGYKENILEFKERYIRLFGFSPEDRPIEIVNIRVLIIETSGFFTSYTGQNKKELRASAKVKGPAFVIGSNTSIVIDPDFEAETDECGTITIRRIGEKEKAVKDNSKRPDPVLLEVFNNIFMGIATEMGITLKKTAHSVNMKERLDFSCALFEPSGNLIANAPHIPVHLGSMADTVRSLIDEKKSVMMPGDIFLTNDPYSGGSHLPDMTVICPVFSEEGRIIFFTAARGHHSDIGGTTPGSMPPSASHIDEEGILIHNFLLADNGNFRETELKELLLGDEYPARNIPERIADLKAQIAACSRGGKELTGVIERYGFKTVKNYMGHIQENAEFSVKNALLEIVGDDDNLTSAFEDYLDDGTPIKVRININKGADPPETIKASIDFAGTGMQHDSDNLNAPLSVTRSAVMYVLRTLIDSDIPLNSGCLNPVDIIAPEGSLLNPTYPAAVSSGNVETSQRVVDVLLGALGIAAASQGTMNNLLFEVEDETPYYETIAGGAGAADGCDGASGIQVHMTNTRMTDPEILEHRHPGIRLERFTLRNGSGGKGEFNGGDGVIREIKFLRPAAVSILSERRSYQPYGMNGGEAGMRGSNLLKKRDGRITELGYHESFSIKKDESIIIKTPGGGGYGKDN